MQVKEYKAFKTPSKTAKENNLILADGVFSSIKRLFDFSLLDGMEISDMEKEIVKNDALKHIGASSKNSMYGTDIDNFTGCSGITTYHLQRVFSRNGKNLYNIFTLAKIKHFHKERESIYDNYSVTTYKASNGFIEPIDDIEIP